MAIKWTNPRELDRVFQKAQKAYDKASVDFLIKKGEEWLTYARENGPYQDHTSNLRNSIGYAVVQYGRVVIGAFPAGIAPKEEGGNPREAKAKGEKYADSIISELNPNKTYLVLVAGMEYAVFVEKKGYWVLEEIRGEIIANEDSILNQFKRKIEDEML